MARQKGTTYLGKPISHLLVFPGVHGDLGEPGIVFRVLDWCTTSLRA